MRATKQSYPLWNRGPKKEVGSLKKIRLVVGSAKSERMRLS